MCSWNLSQITFDRANKKLIQTSERWLPLVTIHDVCIVDTQRGNLHFQANSERQRSEVFPDGIFSGVQWFPRGSCSIFVFYLQHTHWTTKPPHILSIVRNKHIIGKHFLSICTKGIWLIDLVPFCKFASYNLEHKKLWIR